MKGLIGQARLYILNVEDIFWIPQIFKNKIDSANKEIIRDSINWQFSELSKYSAKELHDISVKRLEEYKESKSKFVKAKDIPSWIDESNEMLYGDDELLKIFHFYLENCPKIGSARAIILKDLDLEDGKILKDKLLGDLNKKNLVYVVDNHNQFKNPLERLGLDCSE